MVGADKLQRVHESLSNMANKKKGMPFGGASVICFGDLKQVKKKYFWNMSTRIVQVLYI